MRNPMGNGGVNRREWLAALGALGAGSLVVGACRRHAAGSSGPHRLAIAAASDLRFAMDEVREAFARAHPDANLDPSFGSSGSFAAQLARRAPFDVFLSADVDYVASLTRRGLTLAGSEFRYATGRLALWVRNESSLDLAARGLAALTDPAVHTIALADPAHAPYGRAAVEALRRAGTYDALAPRFVLGASVAQAAQFVQTGSADAGLIALSLAMAAELRSRGRYYELPRETYPEMVQGGAITAWTREPELARAFRAFLLGDGAQGILQRYGFGPPPAEAGEATALARR